MSSVAGSKLISSVQFADFLLTANPNKVYELERAEIIEVRPGGDLHDCVVANVGNVLSDYLREKREGYICGHCAGVVVERDPDTVLGADVMLFEDSTMFGGTFSAPPLIAVEVASPGDTMSKMNRRIIQQLSIGVRLVWLLDIESRTVTVYRPGVGRQIQQVTVEENEELIGDDVLPDFRRRVSEFFAVPVPKKP